MNKNNALPAHFIMITAQAAQKRTVLNVRVAIDSIDLEIARRSFLVNEH
jgi:hypothetical protein